MMVDTLYRYCTFRANDEDLPLMLNRYGDEGWRLHTCNPVVVPSADGMTISVSYIVVMDKAEINISEPEKPSAMEGIAMKS